MSISDIKVWSKYQNKDLQEYVKQYGIVIESWYPFGGRGHTAENFNVCKMNIKGCLACEYCHGKGQGTCIQKDDMQEIYKELKDTQMLVLAGPIYYHGISGQLKCVIDRFYSALYPTAPKSLKKTAMFLSSGDPEMYDGA